MTDVMEHSGIFRMSRRDSVDRYRSADFRNDPPDKDNAPLRETTHHWQTADGMVIELTTEYLYFPFETHEYYKRYKLTVDGQLVQIDRVENFYAFDGTIAPERIMYKTSIGDLVTTHVRIRNENDMGTDKFTDTALWHDRELTALN